MKLQTVIAVIAVLLLMTVSLSPGAYGQATTPAGAMLELTADAVLFAWPEDNAQQLGVLPAGAAMPTNGRLVDSSWWQIPYPGGPNGNAWLKAASVRPNAAAAGVPVYELQGAAQASPTPGASAQTAMVTLTADALVMAWPEDNAEQLGRLPAGASVPTNGRLENSQWWQIPYPGGPNGNGWLPASAVQPNAAAANVPIYEVIVPTPETLPTPSLPTPENCQFNAAFVADVTIPDGTLIQPAQSFTKVWRLRNTGTCPWDATTVLDFIGGSQMSAPNAAPVPPTPPGGTADIGVTMFAPSAAGTYRGVWQLNAQGLFFGDRVTVLIHVPGAEPPAPPPPTNTPPPAPVQPSINFWADTDRVAQGQCTNLHWDVDNAQAVYLEYGGKTKGVGGHDSRQVCPSKDGKRYVLDVIGRDGQHYTREVQINIDNPGVAIRFWADHDKITIGTCTVVRWNVSNSKRVQFNNGSGWADVSENGDQQVCPAYPTNYGLRVTDLNGKRHDRSLTIKTKAPPPGILTPAP